MSELQAWMDQGWLLLYPKEELGPNTIDGKQTRICPVLVFWKLNAYINAFFFLKGIEGCQCYT